MSGVLAAFEIIGIDAGGYHLQDANIAKVAAPTRVESGAIFEGELEACYVEVLEGS